MTIKLSQTVAGNWVITLPNPEEAGWETQLAEFNMEAAAPKTPAYDAIMVAAAHALVAIWAYNRDRGYEVTSHNTEAKAKMEDYVKLAVMWMI